MREKEPVKLVVRKQHVVQSELGSIDAAAQYEYLRDRTFYYEVFENETCLVELDEEPPHPINLEALQIALQVALLMHCKIPDEIQVMRKIVIDGSNPSGFQRTAIVGYDGWVNYKGKRIPIAQVTLEEDAAAKVKESDGKVYYRLNRLGIPLIEVDTGILEGFTPDEIEEIAYTIGLIVQSTRKVKKAIGAIRQDVNVSIEGGARVEIKGVQRLGLIAKVIRGEVERQKALLEKGEKPLPETRGAKEDGTTFFMRPLPGAGRMYPETDIPPVETKQLIKAIKLPETVEEKIEKYKSYGLSDELVKGLLKSDYFFDFDEIVKQVKVSPSIVASTLASVIKDLKRREGIAVESFTVEKLLEVFKLLEAGKILKESIPEVLKYLAANPEASAEKAVEELGISLLSEEELEKVVDRALNRTKELSKAMAIVMSEVRGRADPQKVMALLKRKLALR